MHWLRFYPKKAYAYVPNEMTNIQYIFKPFVSVDFLPHMEHELS